MYYSSWYTYFTVSDYLENALLKRKQKQLDQVDGYAVAEYGIWHTEANETGMPHFFVYNKDDIQGEMSMWFDVITYSSQ